MLRRKRIRSSFKRLDWFSPKRLPHFDAPVLQRKTAEALVLDPDAVAHHAFLPLISFTKRERRFRSNQAGVPVASVKSRPLAYCSNKDAMVFAYYAEQLAAGYEREIAANALDDVSIGYRKGSWNVDLARLAFEEVRARGACVALALDIHGFFDNIDHGVLKLAWARLLGLERLPADHYAVFKALTKYSTVDHAACLERLGLSIIRNPRDLPTPLCSIADFRGRVRGGDGSAPSLIVPHSLPRGIPQGTPLSPVAANIAMLSFDIEVSAEVRRLGGSLRRYSDDILILCTPSTASQIERFVVAALAKHTSTLKLNASKTQRIRFLGGKTQSTPQPLQYLGFLFDGQQVLLRGSTLARQWRKLASAVRWAKQRHRLALEGTIVGRPVLHRRSLLARFSHLGADNFHTGYAKKSAEVMNEPAIQRQLRRHMSRIKLLTSD